MNEREFQTNMTGAESFRSLSQMPESEFWAGYVRGLRRHFHGEKFGTDAEHKQWMAAVDSSDESRRHLGLGYRSGFDGQNIQVAMKSLAGRQYMSEIGRLGGSVTSSKKTRSSAKNGTLGGRPKKSYRPNQRIETDRAEEHRPAVHPGVMPQNLHLLQNA